MKLFKKLHINFNGMTMVEILIITTILGVLATAAFISVTAQLGKARDGKLKSDFSQIRAALFTYYEDTGCFPGSIPLCGERFEQNEAVYMSKIPCDKDNSNYVYESDGTACSPWFRLFATLKNTGDKDIDRVGCRDGCGPGCAYNYGLSSTNVALGTCTPSPTSTPVPTPTTAPTATSIPTPTSAAPTSTPIPPPTNTPPAAPTPTPTTNPFPTSGLLAYWKLDETSGTRVGYAGPNLTVGNTVFSDTGIEINAVKFLSGYNGFLATGDSPAVSGGGPNASRTYTAWAYLTSNAEQRTVIGKYTGGGKEMVVDFWKSPSGAPFDRFRFVVSHDRSSDVVLHANSIGSPALNTWYFIVAWYDDNNDTINIQINDGGINSMAHSQGIANATTSFSVGSLNGGSGSNVWDGRIDEVGIWNRVLSTAEKTYLYNGGSGRQP